MDIKRIGLPAVAALAMLALVAPAAKANVYLSDSEGTLEPGARVIAKSTNLRATLGGGATFSCAVVQLHFELIDAGTEHLELAQLGAGTSEKCTYHDAEKAFPQTITDNTFGIWKSVTIDTWGTVNSEATYVSHIYLDSGHTIKISECHYEGSVHLKAKGETSDKLEVSPSTMVGSPLGSCGHLTTHGDFTLETENEKAISMHFSETP